MSRPAGRPSWPAIADTVGHCVLIFAFVPSLAPIPIWLAFETSNPLNARDPVVLSFVLVRGVNVVLDVFRQRVVHGVLAGVITGAVVSSWVGAGLGSSTFPARLSIGVIAGAVGSALALLAQLGAQPVVAGSGLDWSSGGVAFEMFAGVVCGLLAAPPAVRMLQAPETDQTGSVDQSLPCG